jgi:dTDP-4-dehydrorhamnose 3,5-epimerase
MNFTQTPLHGAYLITLDKKVDERGFFARAFCQSEYRDRRLNSSVVQTNISYSKEKYTLRGFHYQVEGAEEAKSIRCIKGAILDVIIDLRKESPTYCQHYAIELTDENKAMLYVPEGFAHAFLTLKPDTEVLYMVSQFYLPDHERGIRWNDPYFNIQWPTSQPILSKKDANHPDFNPLD